jgi:hypothetical protein
MALSFDEAKQRARLGRFDFSKDGNSELAMGFGADNRTELARIQAAANRSGFTGQSDAELGQLFASQAQKDPNATNPMFGGMSFTDIQGLGGGFNATDFGRSFQAAMDSFNNPTVTGTGTVATGDGTTGTGTTVVTPPPPPPGSGTGDPPGVGGQQPVVELGPLPIVNRDGGMGEVGSSITLFREMLKRGQTPDAGQVGYISQLADRAGLSGEAILKEFTNLPPAQAQAAGASASAQSSLSSVGNAGGPSIAQTLPVGGSSDAMLRAQQQTLTRDSILKGENFAQQAIQNLNPFNVTQSGIKFTTPNAQAQQVNLADYNPNITGGQDATYNVSQYEQDLQQALLGRVNNYGQGANNPYATSLLADVENTAARQREADVTALNKYGVLNSGDTIDVFAQGNEGTQRSRLAALAQAQQYAQNDGSLEAALGLAQLGSNRDLDIGALTGRFGGIDTLAARNSQADFGLRGREQDLTAGLANQSSGLTAQGMNQAQELGIADRRLIDAERLSGDQRFSSDLGLRQLTAQQDLADRVTSRQLIQGSPTGRETFEEGVRAQLANEGLQGRSLDESVNARIASLQNQLDLQDRVNSGSLANTTQQGTNQTDLQGLLNSGALAQLTRQGEQQRLGQTNQGFQDRQLQQLLNSGALDQLTRSGEQDRLGQTNQGFQDRQLQQLLNSGALDQLTRSGEQNRLTNSQQGLDNRLLQTMLNTGALDQIGAQGTNQTSLQQLLNSGAMDQLKQGGLDDRRLQGMLNSGAISQINAQNTGQSALQALINSGALSNIQEQNAGSLANTTQQGTNQTDLQTLLNSGNYSLQELANSGALDQLKTGGRQDRLLQGMLNSGAISQINAQGTNQRSLQDLMNQYSGELATGTYNGQQTLDSLSETQRRNQGDRSFEQILEGLGISNRDASSQIDERQFGQLLGLANASKDNEFLQGQLPDNFFNNFTGAADRLFNQGGSGGFDDFFKNPVRSRAQTMAIAGQNFFDQNENFSSSNTIVDGDRMKSAATGATVAKWNDTTKQWEAN